MYDSRLDIPSELEPNASASRSFEPLPELRSRPAVQKTAFPANFRWGAASAAYQIEGAWNVDGKGPSIWDEFSHRPGKVLGNHTGDVACDHYSRYRDDVAIMREIGLQSYRFSVSWPRVLPNGVGEVNSKGLDFYSALVDSLLEAGIEPWITLFHWDYPLGLYNRGGWLNRDSVEWFGEYADIVVCRLGDRVRHWITLNEPQCYIVLGHHDGWHAPGDRLGASQVWTAMHHTLMAHGRAVQAIRAASPQPAIVGYAPNMNAKIPFEETPENIEAAKKVYFEVTPNSHWGLSVWADPVYLGTYPEEAEKIHGFAWPRVTSEDLALIHQPLDFIGCNIYTGGHVKLGEAGAQPQNVPWPVGGPSGALDWLQVIPDSLYWSARFQTERYGNLPFVVTENGLCNLDWVAMDGKVHDPQRIDYMHHYLNGLKRAASEGIPLGGYFYWSILDNFEWAEGYKSRFGLVHVDYETQRRTVKDSALWYRDIIASHGETL